MKIIDEQLISNCLAKAIIPTLDDLVRTIVFCVVGAVTVLWIWKKLFD